MRCQMIRTRPIVQPEESSLNIRTPFPPLPPITSPPSEPVIKISAEYLPQMCNQLLPPADTSTPTLLHSHPSSSTSSAQVNQFALLLAPPTTDHHYSSTEVKSEDLLPIKKRRLKETQTKPFQSDSTNPSDVNSLTEFPQPSTSTSRPVPPTSTTNHTKVTPMDRSRKPKPSTSRSNDYAEEAQFPHPPFADRESEKWWRMANRAWSAGNANRNSRKNANPEKVNKASSSTSSSNCSPKDVIVKMGKGNRDRNLYHRDDPRSEEYLEWFQSFYPTHGFDAFPHNALFHKLNIVNPFNAFFGGDEGGEGRLPPWVTADKLQEFNILN